MMENQTKTQSIAEKNKALQHEVREKVSTMFTAAFGLVAALAWNQFVQALLEKILPKGDGLFGLLIYAVIVTVVAVLVTKSLARSSANDSAEVAENRGREHRS